ncbi:nicastrin-like isoform X2 [Littorina saxatilis]|uniref:Nicastrin n=2 Tax=Littorina saxatilis TaxID=31220 RepID=A0AAN9BIQ2_9CAEN
MATHSRQLYLLLTLIFLLSHCISQVRPKRIKDMIYIPLEAQNACFRLLNATNQIGCSSAQAGNTGAVHYMQTDDDMDFVLKTGTTNPYIPILDAKDFTTDKVLKLAKSDRVNGIVVISVNLTTSDLPNGFSADKSCPNEGYGNHQGCDKKWNAAGHGMLFEDLDIPIFSLTAQGDVDKILTRCWEPFNKPINGKARTFPVCAVQLLSPMFAAKDAETCIRRSNLINDLSVTIYCDPLGDKNVVTTLKAIPSNETRPPKSVIVVATRVDSFSMFQNEFPSADTTVTGIVTLLATAKALWKLQDFIASQKSSKDVMFAFFQGEAFDYIGSSRMLYEMKKNRFPAATGGNVKLQTIDMKHIAQFVELSQVGLRDQDSLWLHVDPKAHNQTVDMLAKLKKYGAASNTTFNESPVADSLPPASLQTFLKEAGDGSLPSFVVTDHKEAFTNKFYNSRLDVASSIGADYPKDMNDTNEQYNANTTQSERITGLATALAQYLFWAATGNESTPEELQADIEDVNHMLFCFLHSPHCELFNYTISPDNADALNKNKQPFPFYVTVTSSTNQVTSLIQRVLGYFTGKVVNGSADNCKVTDSDERYSYMWMQGPMKTPGGSREAVCYKNTVKLSVAESPAFADDMEDYDWNSRKYSTWTESRWDTFTIRVFMIPSKQFQVLTLTVGIGLLLISLVAVYFINSSADVLFQNAPPDQTR